MPHGPTPNDSGAPGADAPQDLALLHEHLDGGLRVGTLLALARDRGLTLPAADEAGLAAWLAANAHAGSLTRYLDGFALTVAAMGSPAACRRVAAEAAQDAWDDGVRWGEFRIAPQLLEAHGVAVDEAVDALVTGLRDTPLQGGLIVCAMRTDPPARTLAAARLAARWRGRGVIGFDLAGAELGHPPGDHAAAIAAARDAGLGLTLHAGEADGAARVVEAIALGAQRIGHGVRVLEDPRAVEVARAAGVHFEVCPESNVHTGLCPDLASHPLPRMLAAGLSCSIHTDNRLISVTGVRQAWRHAQQAMGLADAQVAAMRRAAWAARFAQG